MFSSVVLNIWAYTKKSMKEMDQYSHKKKRIGIPCYLEELLNNKSLE